MNVKFIMLLLICFISKSAGLTCHNCNDATNNKCSSKQPTFKVCDDDHAAFCGTSILKNGPDAYFTCWDQEFCMIKGCAVMLCREPGTFELEHPYEDGVNFTLTCCEGDLCNDDFSFDHSAAKVNKQHMFLYIYLICMFILNNL